jgi:hypothetical protein
VSGEMAALALLLLARVLQCLNHALRQFLGIGMLSPYLRLSGRKGQGIVSYKQHSCDFDAGSPISQFAWRSDHTARTISTDNLGTGCSRAFFFDRPYHGKRPVPRFTVLVVISSVAHLPANGSDACLTPKWPWTPPLRTVLLQGTKET